VDYLRFLRRERQQSPRSEADAALVAAKTEMLQLRFMEKRKELVRQSDVDALIDDIAGVTLTALSSLPARCAPRGDLATRRAIAQRDKARVLADDIVSANSLAVHLGCTRQNVARLTAEAVIERRSDGCYDQTASRLRYIKHLRGEHRWSARSEADAEFQRAKTELLKIRISENSKALMLFSEHEAFVEMITGMFLSGLAGLAARCGGRDLAVRREIDRAVYDLSKEIAQAANRMADERGEPDEPSS
jgi:hypothetical protein